jgi:predicted cation transporter
VGGNTSGSVTIVSINGLVFFDLNAKKYAKGVPIMARKKQVTIANFNVIKIEVKSELKW